jgi:hypothetical protein
MNRRTELLNQLAAFSTPPEPLMQELTEIGSEWPDGEPALIIITRDHLRSIIGRYLSGTLSSTQLQYWGEIFESGCKNLVFRLANPEINNPLTLETLKVMEHELQQSC